MTSEVSASTDAWIEWQRLNVELDLLRWTRDAKGGGVHSFAVSRSSLDVSVRCSHAATCCPLQSWWILTIVADTSSNIFDTKELVQKVVN